jgi:hypothetical protein
MRLTVCAFILNTVKVKYSYKHKEKERERGREGERESEREREIITKAVYVDTTEGGDLQYSHV